MKLYKFTRGRQVAVTDDPTGSKLPSGGDPWLKMGETDIDAKDGPRVGASSEEIIADIEETGYCILKV